VTPAAFPPDRPAVRFQGATLSYGALDTRSRALAAHLRGPAGLARGDVAALLLPNGLDFFVAAWACQRCGLYMLPLGTKLTAAEIAYILEDSGARVVLTDAELADRVTGVSTFMVAYPLPDAADPDPVEGGDMLYTSGTTGKPKGVRRPLSFAPLGTELRRVERAKALFDMDADTIFFSPAPLYHAAPLRFSLNVHRLGGCVVVMDKFDAAGALDLISQEQVTHSQWVPTMFARLLALSPRPAGPWPHHRVAIHAAAPCPVAVKEAMIAWWGPILHEYYSGTESIGFTHCTSPEWLSHVGTVGKAWECQIHIVGEDGAELPVGETGTVYFEGRAGLAYHNDPDKTAAAHHPQGWATMGDIGHVDADGYLYLTDRRAFTIISGGVNIYPREIEEVLLGHPDVADAAVFGVPDADLGEAVQAVVEPRAGVLADAALAAALFSHCRAALATFKCPKAIDFTAQLPRTDTGKLLKTPLRADYTTRSQRGFTRASVAEAA
jgi:long-chain acyl-CoA synthetase